VIKPAEKAHLQGAWILDDKTDEQLFFSGMNFTQYRNGKLIHKGTYYLVNCEETPCKLMGSDTYTCLVLNAEKEETCYSIMYSDGIDLKIRRMSGKAELLSYHKN